MARLLLLHDDVDVASDELGDGLPLRGLDRVERLGVVPEVLERGEEEGEGEGRGRGGQGGGERGRERGKGVVRHGILWYKKSNG